MTDHTVGILLNIFLSTFPGTFLQYYLNFNRLKIKKHMLVLIYTLIYTMQAIVFLLIQSRMIIDFRTIQLYKSIFSIECVIMSLILIKENRFKLFFTYFINAVCMTAVMRIANHIDLRYAGGTIRELHFLWNNIIMLGVLAVFMPLILLFYKKILKPALQLVDSDIFRIIWVIPALFLAIALLTSSIFSFENMVVDAFLPTTLILLGGMLTSCFVLLKTLRQAAENASLKENVRMTGQLLNLQSEQYDAMTKNSAQAKAARHDLRHQLVVLKSYSSAGDLQKLNDYLDELTGGILDDDEECLLCNNYAVSAVVRHYLSIAKAEGIAVDICLDIPEKAGRVPDMDLCIIIGNLLENAVEACCRMTDGQRFIRVRSKVEKDYLFITVDNSFDGLWQKRGGAYLSRKHAGDGIGLSSVRAVTEKYDGLAEFRASGNLFLSSASVVITQTANGQTGVVNSMTLL